MRLCTYGSERRVGLDERKESWHLGKEAERVLMASFGEGVCTLRDLRVCVCVSVCGALREEEEGRGE